MNKDTDELFMRRCLQLAANGLRNARPNPMVGAVIVSGGRIIGEGYHVRCGEGHAEVNAFASVSPSDLALLPSATLYVSLEPCSHYGRTPPCADLIVSKGVRRVVVGCVDPFAKVQGRGIQRLRDAGIDVTVGVLGQECLELNRRFITFHARKRPYILLKWCQSADGFLDRNFSPVMLSTPFTQMLSHKLRAEYDAILVGRVTAERDRPSLTTRLWSGPSPRRIVLSRDLPYDFSRPVLPQLMDDLHSQGVQSLIVEGGADTLRRFILAGLWDEVRVETAPVRLSAGTRAPFVPMEALSRGKEEYDGNVIRHYVKDEG